MNPEFSINHKLPLFNFENIIDYPSTLHKIEVGLIQKLFLTYKILHNH